MNNGISNFKKEMDLIDLDSSLQELVINNLTILCDQGHSGGSAMFVINALKQWVISPRPIDIEKDDLIYDVINSVSHLDISEQKKIVSITSKLFNNMPLSPLMCEDDEWVELESGLGVGFWNTRCSRVFKGDDGRVFVIDALTKYSPSEDFESWTGISEVIYFDKFPIEVEDLEREEFYLDKEHLVPLSKEINPMAFLQNVHELSKHYYIDLERKNELIDTVKDLHDVFKEIRKEYFRDGSLHEVEGSGFVLTILLNSLGTYVKDNSYRDDLIKYITLDEEFSSFWHKFNKAEVKEIIIGRCRHFVSLDTWSKESNALEVLRFLSEWAKNKDTEFVQEILNKVKVRNEVR